MNSINKINIIPLNKVQKTGQNPVFASTRPAESNSFEKTNNTINKKKIIIALLTGVVTLFAAYKSAKYLKTTTLKKGEKAIKPSNGKPKKAPKIEPPKITKEEGKAVTTQIPITKQSIEPSPKAIQLAEEYKQLLEKQDYQSAITARQKLIELKDEGFVFFNNKLVSKTSKEAFAPLKEIPTKELNSATDLERIECPSILKIENPKFAKLSNPDNFGIENICVSTYNYTARGYGHYFRENTQLLLRVNGMSNYFPETERSWVMGHDYLRNFKTRKEHYVTTLSFGEGMDGNGRTPGFVLSLEGDYSIEQMEALKNRLIETGLIDDLKFIDNYTTGKELIGKIVDETIAFMNKK